MIILKKDQIEILKLEHTIIKTKNSQEGSTADLTKKKRQSVNLKNGQFNVLSLYSIIKKFFLIHAIDFLPY
jgi:hypothetical protein